MKNYKIFFPFLNKNNQRKVYLDNGATTLKPQSVIDAELYFLINNSSNTHANDYKESFLANEMVYDTRIKVQKLINANHPEEIIFTFGTTHSINQIAFGLIEQINKGDEIVLTNLEHSSNMLPWVEISNRKNASIKTMPLCNDGKIDIKKLKKVINKNTKIVTFAHVTNTIGTENNVKEIVKEIRLINKEVIIVVDAAQSIAHKKIDVDSWDVDFLAFSSHKMYGPFGLGVLYGKKHLLDNLVPLIYGGGMNHGIDDDYSKYKLKEVPNKLEAGTMNLSAIAGLNEAINFINEITLESISFHERELKKYFNEQFLINGLSNEFDLYNDDCDSPIILLNKKNVNPQDIATFFDHKYNISCRSGMHCVRRIEETIKEKTTLRISLSISNDKEDIDTLIKAMKDSDNYLEIY